ncbi:hypothetical protein K1T71_002981 [Dendrolimus kikuchii]|uniref:Uncharacterized protein n=1 Tax=Dendrolimus kikuchii TaxID=765133 RepID=A0ACC1DAG9_9NEOP|nr:hypothetical protein K1T71_002981 [Dendrolimus kikuchii]
MNGNTESTSNSIKFEPMPISALLANMMSQQNSDSPDISFSTGEDSDSSFADIVNNKPSINTQVKENILTPVVKSEPNEIRILTSEKKFSSNNHNKENIKNWMLNQKLPDKGSLIQKPKETQQPHSEKKRSILLPQNNNSRTNIVKKTPEICKTNNPQKVKSATPKIKPGIRRFTPGSASKSKKKTPQHNLQQNRDKVRCELFNNGNDSQVSQEPVPQLQHVFQVPVPETPMSRKPMPASYLATPSYPQGIVGNSSKVLFKTTNIKDKKYMFVKKLGTGGSSEVYKVLEVGTSSEYAVKCVYLAIDQELAQGYINEVRLLRELQKSDRVIKLYDYEYDRNNQFLRMVLEVGETDLSSFLKARGAGLPPALVLHYWEEMLHAVAYIHEHGVIHADLKPANFLLVCGRLKLIDFGIASAVSGDATSVVRAQATGTYSYISPEALMGGAGGYGGSATDRGAPIKISYRSDVWSLGCILYSMVYGRTPFAHIPNLAKLAVILNPSHVIDYPPVEHLPPSLIAALKWCLTYNARARPYVRELLSISYLQPTKSPLPQSLLDKLQPLVTPQEFRLLQRAQV